MGWRTLLLTVALTACGATTKRAPNAVPACEAVVRNIQSLGTTQPGAEAEAAAWAADAQRRCETSPWSAEARSCLADARTQDDLAACGRAERLARGDDLGGPDCATVVAHEVELWRRWGWSAHDEQAASLRYCTVRSRAYKDCFLASATQDEVAACKRAENAP